MSDQDKKKPKPTPVEFQSKPYKCPGYCCNGCMNRQNYTLDEQMIVCWMYAKMFKKIED